MIIRIFILFSSLFIFNENFAHESYLSVTQMRYNVKDNTIQCEMKITAHDLEKSLKITSGKPVILDDDSKQISNDQLLEQYLQNKFSVRINGEKVYVDYVGFEVELNDNAWIYFEIKCPPAINKIEISNLILTETFALQQNVTHLTYYNTQQSFVFNKTASIKTFLWNE